MAILTAPSKWNGSTTVHEEKGALGQLAGTWGDTRPSEAKLIGWSVPCVRLVSPNEKTPPPKAKSQTNTKANQPINNQQSPDRSDSCFQTSDLGKGKMKAVGMKAERTGREKPLKKKEKSNQEEEGSVGTMKAEAAGWSSREVETSKRKLQVEERYRIKVGSEHSREKEADRKKVGDKLMTGVQRRDTPTHALVVLS